MSGGGGPSGSTSRAWQNREGAARGLAPWCFAATGLPVYEAGSVIRNLKTPKNLGMLRLALWLILFGVLTAPFLTCRFAHGGEVLAVPGLPKKRTLLLASFHPFKAAQASRPWSGGWTNGRSTAWAARCRDRDWPAG